MGDAGGSQAVRRPLDASQNAPRPTPQHRREDHNNEEGVITEWHAIVDTLQSTESDLLKEEETPGQARVLAGIRKAISQVRDKWTLAIRGGDTVESRLIRIEDIIQRVEKKCNGPSGPGAGKGGT
jgi:hypothetical protein